MNRKPTVLVILSGGGFTFETCCLLDAIRHDCDFVYLKTHFGGTPGEDGLPDGNAYPVPSFATMLKRSVRMSAYAFHKTFMTTLAVIRREKIDLVLAVGCSHAVPMCLAARLLGRRTVYIESITRVEKLSNTGRIVRHLRLATMFIVQWPSLQKSVPTSLLGTIL